jgi:hypothetical protein
MPDKHGVEHEIVKDRQRSKPTPNEVKPDYLTQAFQYMSKILRGKLEKQGHLFVKQQVFPYHNHKTKTCGGNKRRELGRSRKRKIRKIGNRGKAA